MGFPCFWGGDLQFMAPARRLGNALRFWGEITRERKICATRWSPIFCRAQLKHRAPFTPKPGHISQSPRSSLGYLKWNQGRVGCKRQLTLHGVRSRGLRDCNARNTDSLRCPCPAICTLPPQVVLPVHMVSDWHLCAFTVGAAGHAVSAARRHPAAACPRRSEG